MSLRQARVHDSGASDREGPGESRPRATTGPVCDGGSVMIMRASHLQRPGVWPPGDLDLGEHGPGATGSELNARGKNSAALGLLTATLAVSYSGR